MVALTSVLCACTGPPAGSTLVNKKLPRTDIDVRIYKVVNGRELQIHIFYPPGYSAAGKKNYPVAVSIHGGGWSNGLVEWGHGDARFMTTLGFVGMAVEYRLANQGNVTALDCMKDANSAVRWIRLNAKELTIDPERVLTIGHSAGGHLALSTAMFPNIMEEGEDKEINSVPNVVVALAPADRFPVLPD
jgi:acetyl esterase